MSKGGDDDALVIKYCVGVAAFTAVVLGGYYAYDPYKNVERFYFQRCKVSYAVVKGAYFILFIAFMISVQTIVRRVFWKST